MGFMDQVKMRAKNAQYNLVSLIKPEAPYEQWLKDNPIGKGLREGMEFKMIDKEVVRHRKMIDMIHKTYKKKNRDYGDAFGVSLDKRGMVAALIRMEDKMGRLDSLKDRDPLVKDESLQDTLLDLANYAIMTAMWLERKGEKKVTEVYADGKVAITIDNEKVAAISTEDYLAMRAIVNDTLNKIDDDIEEVEEMKTGHEARTDKVVIDGSKLGETVAKNFVDTFDFSKMAEKVVEAHEKMEFKEHTPLAPGIKLVEGRKMHITNNGSYELDGGWLTTRDIEGNVIDTARVDAGQNLILTVIPEPKEVK